MNALDALRCRVSVSKVQAPAPTKEQLDVLFAAAIRAADHGQLRPWRFLVVEGEGLPKLGNIFAEAALADDPQLSPNKCESMRSKALRAPMIVICIACCQKHPKVPELEQLLAAGAATQNILNAAYGLGIGAIWKTGAMAYHQHVKASLGLIEGESIIGFLYMGTPIKPLATAKQVPTESFFTFWRG